MLLALGRGDTGHKIICEIAFQELSAPARERARGLMRQDQEFSLFSESCTWPDHPILELGAGDSVRCKTIRLRGPDESEARQRMIAVERIG